jgi:N-acetylglucosaminyl-diphospho-decaprenol L-rhamnosyltransferase
MVRPTVSVIVVSWNCAGLLAQCLASLRTQTGLPDLELLVIDNASLDDSADTARRCWPGASVIVNPRNLGFAKASNQGLAAATGDVLLLLNPDTVLPQPDTLSRVLDRLAAYPAIDMAGVRLVFADGRHQVGDGGFEPTLGHALAHAFGLTKLSPRLRGLFLQDGSINRPWGRVGWVCGAFTALRRSAWQRAGGMDESYFLYGEDVEWGCRLNQLGLTVAYLPDIQVVHLQGGTQRKPHEAPGTRWIDGLSRLFWRHNGGRGFTLYRAGMAAGFGLRALAAWPRSRQRCATMARYARSFWHQQPPPAGEPQR